MINNKFCQIYELYQIELKINAQVRMYSLANLSVRHYVELTVFEGKLGRYLMLPFLKLRFFF